ncbi:rRNA pseudouridine synthase [Gammaproteobacteria bacterium]|nr:rRNA pseudouridine synthase [SAR86 cluster bacterium]MDA7554172.1 rRNA pseudouridine synthase [Gammaproteobacteria bacterium]MDA7554189.1 rRNA pseudouridine synthase [Gammaproteobacteria bacterium]MDC0508982.1 rRNA pseudouridine synthase [Gammaproteobacteria bacterium]MDC0590909.1 rRNA pseudouridine synthase [Gammaproteobacteria bacterium]
MKARIHKILADHGIGSRRGIEKLITQKKVTVNGTLASIGQFVSERDIFEIDGKTIKLSKKDPTKKRILMYNKKVGEISSRNDPDHKKTIFDSLPRLRSGRWVSIGRLDINTSGLILFTNDGTLANKLMHPSSNIEREYVARVHGHVTENIVDNLMEGVELEDGFAKFTDVQGGRKGNTNQWFAMVLMEGRSREVRRLWESQGLEISRLKRVRYGNLFLPAHLKQGAFKELTKGEINALERQ